MSKEYGIFDDAFPLTEGERRGIDVSDEETEALCSKGSKCLVGRLGVAKKLNKEALKSLLLRIWRPVGRVFFKEIQENLWLFEFDEESDKQRVLDGRSWSYDRTLLILNDFDGKTPPSKMDFSTTPMWVQIHDMPLGCMNRKIGNKIGSSIGVVEDIAIADDDVGWGRSLRIRVAINLFQPLERSRKLNLSGNSCWVPFKYEKLSVFCFKCGCIIHGEKGCSVSMAKKLKHSEGPSAWGPWLRADDLSRGLGMFEGQRGSRSPSPYHFAPAAENSSPSSQRAKEGKFPEGGKNHGSVSEDPNFLDATSAPFDNSKYGKHSLWRESRKGNNNSDIKEVDMGRNKRKGCDSGRSVGPTYGADGQKEAEGSPGRIKDLESGLQPNSGKTRETTRLSRCSADPPQISPKFQKFHQSS
jgi:hypothetical protein